MAKDGRHATSRFAAAAAAVAAVTIVATVSPPSRPIRSQANALAINVERRQLNVQQKTSSARARVMPTRSNERSLARARARTSRAAARRRRSHRSPSRLLALGVLRNASGSDKYAR